MGPLHKSRTCVEQLPSQQWPGDRVVSAYAAPLQGAPWSPGREESWAAAGELFSPEPRGRARHTVLSHEAHPAVRRRRRRLAHAQGERAGAGVLIP